MNAAVLIDGYAKGRLGAIRHLFDLPVTGEVVPAKPAASKEISRVNLKTWRGLLQTPMKANSRRRDGLSAGGSEIRNLGPSRAGVRRFAGTPWFDPVDETAAVAVDLIEDQSSFDILSQFSTDYNTLH